MAEVEGYQNHLKSALIVASTVYLHLVLQKSSELGWHILLIGFKKPLTQPAARAFSI